MNKICEALENFVPGGNVVPRSWYQRPEFRNPSGKPNTVAIILMSDLICWYSPIIVRDEATGEIVAKKPKFAGDKLYRNYELWGDRFGFTKRQVQEACYFLRDNGLITIEIRNVLSEDGEPLGSRAFIEPVLDALLASLIEVEEAVTV